MIAKPLSTLIRFSCALVCAPLALIAADPLESYLPESTFATFKFEKAGTLFELEDSDSAFARYLNDPQVQAFFAPAREHFEAAFKDQARFDDYDLEKFKEVFKGQALWATFLVDGDFEKDTPWVVMLEYSGSPDETDRWLHPLSDAAFPPEGATVDSFEESFMGETLHIEEVTSETRSYANGYALVGDVLILGHPVQSLKDMVARVKDSDTQARVTESALFERALGDVSEHEFFAYLSLKQLMPAMREGFLEGLKIASEENPQMLAMGITPDSLWNALGLDAVEAFSMSLGTYREHPGARMAFLFEEKRGLLNLMAYTHGSGALPSFVPENAVSASVSYFSIGQMWAGIEEILATASPNIRYMLDMQLEQFKGQTGVDVRAQIIDNFSSEIISFMLPEGAAQAPSAKMKEFIPLPTLYAIEVKDGQALLGAVETLAQGIAPGMELFVRREYLGREILSLRPELTGGQPAPFNFCVDGGYLFISLPGADVLEQTLARIDSREAGLFQQARVEESLAVFPHHASGYSYLDMTQYMDVLFGILLSVQEDMVNQQAFGDEPSEAEEPIILYDADAIPEGVVLPYMGLGTAVQSEDALRMEVLMFETEERP